MRNRILFTVIGLIVCATPCCTMMAILDSDSQSTTAPDGRKLVKDTAADWEEFKSIVDSDVQDEDSGKPASGGFSWNDRWVGSIESLREGRENHQRYVDYIIGTRRRHGLPDLRGL